MIVATITAIAGLVTAVAALVRATRGERDHAANVDRLRKHAERLNELESGSGRKA